MEETVATTVSRRKQQKPARVVNKCSSSTSHPTSVIVRTPAIASGQKSKPKPSTTVSKTTDKKECSKCHEGKDIAGRLKRCNLNEGSSRKPEVICIASTSNGTNCELLESGSPSTASSTSPSNISTSDGQNALLVGSNDRSMMNLTPHAIYLPVAYHNAGTSHIQVVGYPQLVIPVAVDRSTAHLYKPSLFVDDALSQGLEMPESLDIGGTILMVDKITYQSNISNTTTDNLPEPPPTTSKSPKTTKKKVSTPCRAGTKRRTPSDGSKPLDLSVHVKEKRPSVTVNPDSTSQTTSSTETEKRFRCQCGVSFNNETTMLGHRKYYCNSNTNATEISREPHKRTVTRCNQCEFQPVSANQLVQHMRANHCAVKAYICQLCGYKGYSQRGIRSHLRTHAECSGGYNEELMQRHVSVVTPDSEKLECGECHTCFDSKQLMKQHDCKHIIACNSVS